MKKVIVVLMILLLPLSAMAAMTSISDSEMADVSGQVGISIAIVDFNMDMSIANFTYDDQDKGTVVVSNRNVGYDAGFINIGPIVMDNIYVTLSGNPVYAAGTSVNSAMLKLAATSTMAQLAGISSSYNGIAGDMLTIDVMTAERTSANPYYALRANTYGEYDAFNAAHTARSGILIGLPDMYISLDGIDIDGIYIDSIAGDSAGLFYPVAEKFLFTNASQKDPTKSLGSFHIGGIAIHTYSSVAGVTTDALNPNWTYRSAFKLHEDGSGNPERYYPGNRAYMLIAPH